MRTLVYLLDIDKLNISYLIYPLKQLNTVTQTYICQTYTFKTYINITDCGLSDGFSVIKLISTLPNLESGSVNYLGIKAIRQKSISSKIVICQKVDCHKHEIHF